MLFKKRSKKDGRRTGHGLEKDISSVQHLSRRTEPGAQSSGMRGGLMMRVMRRVGDRLRVNRTAEDQQAGRETGRKHVLKRLLHGYGSKANRDACCVSRSTT
jgi:hypothetical protein